MPIVDKIAAAKVKYNQQLEALKKTVEDQKPDFEKNAIAQLLSMIELKTEMDILEKVRKHQSGE